MRVNSHLVQLSVLPMQETPIKVSVLGTRRSASSHFSRKVGMNFLPSHKSASRSPSFAPIQDAEPKLALKISNLATEAVKGNELYTENKLTTLRYICRKSGIYHQV